MKNLKENSQDKFSRVQAVEILGMIIDPELGINIIDMGLLYQAEVDNEQKVILIGMTLSSRGCPMGAAILGGSENILKSYFPEYTVDIKLVWEPAWTPDFISENGKQLLE